jgi:spermidine synthase
MNTTWHWRANATNLLSREFFELVKRHLSPGGAFFFNTTYSHDVCRTATESFPHTLRVINFVAGSDSPIDVDPVRWKDMLESYRIDGRPVLDLDTDRGRNAEARLVATMKPGDGKAELELDANLRKTCADGEIVTDDNMLPEWRELVH